MAKKASVVFGIIFVIVGVLGFIPNPIVGEMGLFHADAVHNIVHLILGIVLLITAKKPAAAVTLIVVGVIYLLLAIIGFVVIDAGETAHLLGIAEANGADNWLHLVLAIVLLGVGFKAKKETAAPMVA
ncbi:MAG: DUF4383 domain-containing protein [Patescibacteria group bacterium]